MIACLLENERGCESMDFEKDPNARRRLDGQGMMERDEEVAGAAGAFSGDRGEVGLFVGQRSEGLAAGAG
jgi:hypothetical protein